MSAPPNNDTPPAGFLTVLQVENTNMNTREVPSLIKSYNFTKFNEQQMVDINTVSISAGPDPHVPLNLESRSSTLICRFYDYIPRATDSDLYPRIWELFTSCQSI